MNAEVRDVLEKAWEHHESGTPMPEKVDETASSETPSGGGAAPVAASAAVDAPKGAPSKEPAKQTPGQAAKEARQAQTPSKVAAKTPTQQRQEGTAAVEPAKTRAPASWNPAVREHWNALPDPVRDFITQREAQITSELTQSASARKLADDFVQSIRPYEQMIRAARTTPIQAVRSLLNNAAVLQAGTAAQKVAVAAAIIKTYGVDIQQLDAALSGQVRQDNSPNAQIERIVNERLAPMHQLMERLNQSDQQSVQALAAEASSEIEEFASSEDAEFLDDVKDEVADLLEVAAKRGRELSLKQAYEIACSQNPEIAQVRTQRAEAQRIAAGGGAAARARVAAASLPAGAPPAGGGVSPMNKNASRRDALERAWGDLSSR